MQQPASHSADKTPPLTRDSPSALIDEPALPVVVGFSYRTTPFDKREHFESRILREAAWEARNAIPGLLEGAVLSTCARFELYGVTASGDSAPLHQWLAAISDIDEAMLRPHLYDLAGTATARHLFNVTCGLDSIVFGEPQILGQVKHAFAKAREQRAAGAVLGRLFEHAAATAKAVRTETGIGRCPLSIAGAAIAEVERLHDSLDHLTALVVGAGDNATVAARHLREKGIKDIIVANRTLAHARTLAESLGGRAISLEALDKALPDADLVISTTGAGHVILDQSRVRAAMAMRPQRALLVLDLAVPRDVAVEVGDLPNVELLAHQDLERVTVENLQRRKAEAGLARELVENGVGKFTGWLESRRAVPAITALRSVLDNKRTDALAHARRKLRAGHSAEAVVEELAHRLTASILHHPTVALTQARAGELHDTVSALDRLFGLEPPPANRDGTRPL